MEYDRLESAVSGALAALLPGKKAPGAIFADPEKEIIDAVREGDSEAFGRLARRYEDFVFTLVRSLVHNDVMAEDVAQEVFLRAYKGIRRFELRSSFKTWLYRIAYNTAVSHIRRERSTASIDPANLEDPALDLSDNPSLRLTMERLIEKLRPEYKAVIVLHYYDDLKYEEIAEILECPMGTVKIRLYRAKHELKELWSKYAI